MSKPVKQLRQFDRVEPTPLWSAIEARRPRPEVPPPPNKVRRAAVIVSALALFIVAGAFAWSAFRPSSEPAAVGSADSTALVATLQAPEDGTIPGLTLAYGGTSRDYFAEAGHWPGVNMFNQPGFAFGEPLLPGTSLMIAGDASQVDGNVGKFVPNESTADIPPLPLDLGGGSATLPTDPGRYTLHLTGTWPQGTAEFFVVIDIQQPSGPGAPVSISSRSYQLARPATEVAAAGGFIWVAESSSRTIEKIDPSTGDVIGSWAAPGDPAWLAAGNGVIWVAASGVGADDVVIGVNTQTDETYSIIHGVTGPLVQTDEGLWGFEYRSPGPSWMVLLDPQSGDVIRHVEVASQPFEAAASGRSLWLLDLHTGTVTLISEDGSARIVTDRSSGVWLAGTPDGVYLGAWRGTSANDQNGPGTSAFASLDGQVQPIGDIYNFRPMVVVNDRVWFVAGPHDGNISGLCGMRNADGVVDRCTDIPVSLESSHDPVAFDPTTGTLWAVDGERPTVYVVNAG